jgi:hypothetical protein
MGPSRIGTLPRTRWWDEVVDLIAHRANVSQVTDTTLWAAQKALGTVSDAGFGQPGLRAATRRSTTGSRVDESGQWKPLLT